MKHPDLPLVDVGGKSTNLLPAELCTILLDQHFRGKPLEEHVAFMTKYSSNPPNVNARVIESRGLQQLGFADAPALTAFGIGIGGEMATVPGRVLAPPEPRYLQNANGSDFKTYKGSWNMKNVQFTRGASLENWVVFAIHDGNLDEFKGPADPEFLSILRGFMTTCSMSGMAVKNPPKYAEVVLPPKNRTEDPMRSIAINKIRAAIDNVLPHKPDIIMVILSSGDRHVYSGLKHLCDVTLDVRKWTLRFEIRENCSHVSHLATLCVQSSRLRIGDGTSSYYLLYTDIHAQVAPSTTEMLRSNST